MLFNSYAYIFLFLPITFAVYFVLNRKKLTMASRMWLVIASLAFYGWWNMKYLPLILGSIFFNYGVGTVLARMERGTRGKDPVGQDRGKMAALLAGIGGNVLLLGYYKYTDFLIENINNLAGWQIPLAQIVLPLGISFFTFTQIAFLVDSYRGAVKEYSLLNYALFVTFFPHLLAGPIIHHKEMMPQFASMRNKVLNHRNIAMGLYLFSIGLFKKVVVADEFAVWATAGFDGAKALSLGQAWITSLSYTFQIYFDFSGYTDMALGSALMFNIKLPINFNSPYKSMNIQEFWQTWHMTLSRFLRDYIYVPLGGNRVGEARIYLNFMATFLIGGLWHGAGWNFIFWGFLHGVAMVANGLWKRRGLSMNRVLAWLITFNFINATWVFFRARTWDDAMKVLKGMCGLTEIRLPAFLSGSLSFLLERGIRFGENLLVLKADDYTIWMIIATLFAVLVLKNSNEMVVRFHPDTKRMVFAVAVLTYAIFNLQRVTQFIYFQF
jgi:D-alanyl-lipoteichoic acid acyltransferase DltB (MBOAT superfamily)